MARPIEEYGNVIWCPHPKKDIVANEKIQRRAIKIISILKYLPCKEILQCLNFTTLKVTGFFMEINEIDHYYILSKAKFTLILYKRTYFQNSLTSL